jgi:hypothetical protein
MERLGLGRIGEQAFQNYETQLHLLNQHIQQRRLKYESVEATQAWEEPSTETPTQHSNFINYVGPQKRKRGNETERRVTRSGGVSSGITSGEPSPHISVSMVRNGEQEVSVNPNYNICIDCALITTYSSCHIVSI